MCPIVTNGFDVGLPFAAGTLVLVPSAMAATASHNTGGNNDIQDPKGSPGPPDLVSVKASTLVHSSFFFGAGFARSVIHPNWSLGHSPLIG
jgi:hypothetical protein